MFWIVLQIAILACLALVLLITLTNLFAFRYLGRFPMPARFPRISVLVPARDEEANIGTCVRSLLAQDYPDFELIVLDDSSTDATPRILADLAGQDSRLRVLKGTPLPEDWLGKNWACHQLAQAAQSELIVFTDADTRHAPNLLRDAVAALEADQADFLSLLPYEEVGSWSERVTVPFYSYFSSFALSPFMLAYRTHSPLFAAANGQFMLFRRTAYDQIGGYPAVQRHAIDDVALVRRVASHKVGASSHLRWRLYDGGRHIRTRMYRKFREVFEGYSKNLFAAFEYRILPFVLTWLWLEVMFWEPLIMLFLALCGVRVFGHQFAFTASAVGASLLIWGILYGRFRMPVYQAVVYPLTMVLIVMIAWRSMALTLSGRTTWKGRTLVKHRVRIV
jgi:chlorobactene glucosyltransferase